MTQYGRHVSDLRSTNGHVQAKANGDELLAIETYGGVISFNLEECWYLDSQFCAPLHALRASMGAGVAEKMLRARAAYYYSTGRKSGVMTWRLLHLPDRASSLLLLTMPAARHVGLHRARDHRDHRGRLCGRHGRYGRPRAA